MACFKSYICDLRFRNGLPVIITASAVHHNHVHYSESYLLVPDDQCHLTKECKTFDSDKIPSELLTVDDQFLHDEALRIAGNVMLTEYIYARYPDFYEHKYPRYTYPPREQHNNLLVGLWMQGFCREKLLEVKANTNCEDLRNFIELLQATFVN